MFNSKMDSDIVNQWNTIQQWKSANYCHRHQINESHNDSIEQKRANTKEYVVYDISFIYIQTKLSIILEVK